MKESIKEIKIEVPDGMIIDEENSTFSCIKFKPAQKKLPKCWDDLDIVSGYFIDYQCEGSIRHASVIPEAGKMIFPSKELAEAAFALSQLLQLRDIYNDGWISDCTNRENKFCITVIGGKLIKYTTQSLNMPMHFKSAKLRFEFFENFEELLEIAKPLL